MKKIFYFILRTLGFLIILIGLFNVLVNIYIGLGFLGFSFKLFPLLLIPLFILLFGLLLFWLSGKYLKSTESNKKVPVIVAIILFLIGVFMLYAPSDLLKLFSN